MTEEQQQAVPSNSPGPGQILKLAREKMGLTVADIAGKLHLKVINIEAIEADNYDPKVSLTFTKGYLKLYAKQVHVPENVVLEAFALHHVEEKEPAKLQSFSKRVAKQANDDRLMLLTYLIVAVLLALVVIWWFQQDSSEPAAVIETPSIQSQPSENIPEATPRNPTPDDLIVSAQREAELAAQQDDLASQLPDDASQDIESQANSLDELSAQSALTDEGQTIDLVFEFANNCWMKLTDSTGEDIAYGEKKAGRVMSVSGVAPFEVTLCSPGVVKISYDGVLVDMSRFDPTKAVTFSLPFSQS
ncbi:RodZ domain-containing protein [Aliiglaciecola litoralis]|uniref:DUF4115 domain-containing protein n=1 Tax=Aliiglaciecola litoralis TaxID=582857 RepID=A0ABN1LL22_9ALTE